MDLAAGHNATLAAEAPALYAALSTLGRRAFFPREIPFQAAEARGVAYNGTIGQITDGAGRPLILAPMAEAASGLSDADRDLGFLYSPIAGLPDVCARWRNWQRRHDAARPATTVPIVTAGLSHGVSMLADLFGGPDRPVVVPEPFWGSYRHIFGMRGGARVLTAPVMRDGELNVDMIPQALAAEPPGEPTVAILNFPHNPMGYMPRAGERGRLRAALVNEAGRRPLVVLCDDAYEGLVYEPDVPRQSLFWDLAGAHPNLVPVKVDGATKEFALFGGRVGFLTFALEPDSAAAAALTDKIMGLIRATIGSPVALGQVMLLQALRAPDIAAAIEALRLELEGRYRALKAALATVDPGLMRPLPFNAGCFALVELPDDLGVDAEHARRHLLRHHDAGVTANGRYLRIAFCSVATDDIPELVARVERGVAELATRQAATRS